MTVEGSRTYVPELGRALARFPEMLARNRRAGEDYYALWGRWRAGPFVPLRVTARLASGYVAGLDEALHLDGVLSAALAARSRAHMTSGATFVLPLPLALAWISDRGRPLWLASDLRPKGRSAAGEAYLHKRWPDDRASLATRPDVVTSAGRFKDVRLPLAVTLAAEVEGWCLGIEDEVRALLDGVSHVGRKAAHGRGRVLAWSVEPLAHGGVGAGFILERRMTPLAALAVLYGDREAPPEGRSLAPRIGWSPPYWDARFHLPCRRPAWTP